MSISTVSASSNSYQNYWSKGTNSVGQQFKQDFQDLSQALQSGNLNGAQQAFSVLQQLMPNVSSSDSQQQKLQPITGTSSIDTDLSALTQAIQSGNQTDTQTDLSKLTQDLQSVGRKEHHHHHHHHAYTSSQGTTAAASDASSSSYSGNAQNSTTASASGISSGISQYLATMAKYELSAGNSLNVSI